MLITWLLLRGARESATRQQHHGGHQAAGARRCSSPSARRTSTRANYTPFAPNGFTGIHQGAAIVFFAYIGFDAISTAAEETKNPQRNLPIGILGGLAICTVIYVIVGAVLTGHGAVQGARRSPIRWRTRSQLAGLQRGRLDRRARRGGLDVGGAAGVPVRPAAHLLRDGARRPAAAVGGEASPARRAFPYATTLFTGVFVALWSLIGDAAETYDLTNIGTLFAFVLVCIGVLVLRYKEPERPRPFRVPFVWPVSLLLGARGLPVHHGRACRARRGSGSASGWSIGLVLYFALRLSSTAGCTRLSRRRDSA